MTQQTTQRTNKELVGAFLKTAFGEGKVKDAIAKYTNGYKQHNPTVKDGPEGLVEFATTMGKQFPNMQYDVKRMFQDGDFVIVHANLRLNPDERGMAVVDIFRCQNGKVVEHWDVMQQVPETAANNNTMF